MATYEKLTPEVFKTRLANGTYQDLTGARRAIGKATWADADKDKARKQAEAKFGAPVAKPAQKQAKKSATAKPAKTAASKPGPKAKPGPKPRTPVGMLAAASDFPVINRFTTNEIKKNPIQMIQLAEQGVQSGTAALNAITTAQTTNPTIGAEVYSEARSAAVKTICRALDLSAAVISNLAEGLEIPDAIRHAAAQETLPEASEPESVGETANGTTVPGKALYEAPAAPSAEA